MNQKVFYKESIKFYKKATFALEKLAGKLDRLNRNVEEILKTKKG